MRSKKKKISAIALVLIVGVLAISGTIAWLTRTSSVTNTFTVGSFEVPNTSPTDPETPIEIDGNIYEPSWVVSDEHKLVPAISFDKDPYIGIGAGSEDAAVYAYVENSFSNKVYFTINSGWEAVSAEAGFAEGTYTSGLFKYTAGLKGSSDSDTWTTTPLFSSVNTDESATAADFTVGTDEKMEIKVSSFLHQTKKGDGTLISEDIIEDAAKKAFDVA